MASINYNPFEPKQLENPYKVYKTLREENPVFYHEPTQLWLVTRYKDICTVMKDASRFSAANADKSPGLAPEAQSLYNDYYQDVPALVDSDPPTHTRLRGLFNKWFTPTRVLKLEPNIRRIANEIVDGFIAEGEGDFIEKFAYPFPLSVIAHILGIPVAQMHQCKQWSDDRIALFSPANLTVEAQITCVKNMALYRQYLEELITVRQEDPQNDMISYLAKIIAREPEKCTKRELVFSLIQTIAGGHETSTSLICSGLYHLLNNPAHLEMLQQTPDLIPNAIEEFLRLDAPVQGLFRTATVDTQLGGVSIPQGARLHVLFASGNRDKACFATPDKFDPHRHNLNTHLSFGHGVHYCIGVSLARLENKIAFETILDRFPKLRFQPDHPSIRRPHFFLRGFSKIYLSWN